MSILNLIPSLTPADPGIPRGVAFNPPPPHMMADAIASVNAQMLQVPPGARGAIVAVGTYGPNGPAINAAIAVHGPFGTQIEGWIGKSWGQGINAEVKGIKVF